MVALDANILQELLENRKHSKAVQATIKKYTNKGENFAASSLTISHVFYLSEAHGISVKKVEGLVARQLVYSVMPEDVSWALEHYKGQDFEDALQVAAAKREGCSVFLTLDVPLAKKYRRFVNVQLVK